eukprot:364615-Chlamydomonas_euryale.AAC.20
MEGNNYCRELTPPAVRDAGMQTSSPVSTASRHAPLPSSGLGNATVGNCVHKHVRLPHASGAFQVHARRRTSRCEAWGIRHGATHTGQPKCMKCDRSHTKEEEQLKLGVCGGSRAKKTEACETKA